jgi:hypothetical protein
MKLDEFLLSGSENFKDYSWVPFYGPKVRRYPDGKWKRKHPSAPETSYISNPNGDLTADEISMAKSGASYKDLMFLRAMQLQNEDGFSPYFNPNIDHSKKKK